MRRSIKLTIYPKPKQFRKLFSFYDEVVAGLVSNGIEKADAEYAVKHFLEVFAYDPEGWRKELK